MTDETKKELETMRNRMIELRDQALGKNNVADFDAQTAVSLSHAIRALHFAIKGEEWKEPT